MSKLKCSAHKKHGWSLIELLIYFAVLASLGNVIFLTFDRLAETLKYAASFMAAKQKLQAFVNSFQDDVRNASDLLDECGEFRSSPKTLVLAARHINVDDGGNVEKRNIVYDCDGERVNRLAFRIGSEGKLEMVSRRGFLLRASEMSFVRTANNIIETNIKVKRKLRRLGRVEKELRFLTTVRNYRGGEGKRESEKVRR